MKDQNRVLTFAESELARIAERIASGTMNQVNFQGMGSLERHLFQQGQQLNAEQRLAIARGKKL